MKKTRTVVLASTNGLGDNIIGVAGIAMCFHLEGFRVITATKPQHIPIMAKCPAVWQALGIDEYEKIIEKEWKVYKIPNCLLSKKGDELIAYDYYEAYFDAVAHKNKIPFLEPMTPDFIIESAFIEEWPEGCHTVFLHPGARNPTRRWTNSKWRDLALLLRKKGYYIMWGGTKSDYGFNGDRIRKLSDIDWHLGIQSKFLAGCNHFIGNDSGFAHLAGCLGIPSQVIFLSTDPQHVISHYSTVQAVEAPDAKYTRSLAVACDTTRSNRLAITPEVIAADIKTIQDHVPATNDALVKECKRDRCVMVSFNLQKQTDRALYDFLAERFNVISVDTYNGEREGEIIIQKVGRSKYRIYPYYDGLTLMGSKAAIMPISHPETVLHCIEDKRPEYEKCPTLG